MNTEVLLFCIVATIATFGIVLKIATSEPTLRKRSFKSGNWGNYTESPTTAAQLTTPRR